MSVAMLYFSLGMHWGKPQLLSLLQRCVCVSYWGIPSAGSICSVQTVVMQKQNWSGVLAALPVVSYLVEFGSGWLHWCLTIM